jgi:hypothetical protein
MLNQNFASRETGTITCKNISHAVKGIKSKLKKIGTQSLLNVHYIIKYLNIHTSTNNYTIGNIYAWKADVLDQRRRKNSTYFVPL